MVSRKQYYELERVVKGAANHRRIEILDILKQRGSLSTDGIVQALGINYQTGAAHARQLVRAGLVSAHRHGFMVLHELSPRGKSIISFLKKL